MNNIYYGLGYFVFFIFVLISKFRGIINIHLNYFLELSLNFILVLFSLIIFSEFDLTIILRICMIFLTIFISLLYSKSPFLNSKIIAIFFLILSLITSFYSIKQFFYGYSNIDYYFLSLNDTMNEEFQDFGIKRGLGIYFDPLAQMTIIGIGVHSIFFLKNICFLKKTIFLFLLLIIFLSSILTLSRAGILGLFFSLIIYLKKNYIKDIISLFSIILSLLIFFIFFNYASSTDLDNVTNSLTSLGQIINLDVEVSSRFNAAGSYSSRIDGMSSVLTNIFNQKNLENIKFNHSARDLGYFAIPPIYGPITFLLFLFYSLKLFFRISPKLFKAKSENLYIISVIILIFLQSFVTFQLDSIFIIFILFLFIGKLKLLYI